MQREQEILDQEIRFEMEDLGLEVMTPKQEKRRERMLKQLETIEPENRLINPWQPSYECDLEEDQKERILKE